MIRIVYDDVWKQSGLVVVTPNSFITRAGALVMGRGAALQARERIAGIDLAAGAEITQTCAEPSHV